MEKAGKHAHTLMRLLFLAAIIGESTSSFHLKCLLTLQAKSYLSTDRVFSNCYFSFERSRGVSHFHGGGGPLFGIVWHAFGIVWWFQCHSFDLFGRSTIKMGHVGTKSDLVGIMFIMWRQKIYCDRGSRNEKKRN